MLKQERSNSAETKKERTNSKILVEAARLFRKRGILGTSVADVMSGAGMTVGGFYAHFRSKEDLVVKSMKQMVQQADDLAARIEAPRARERALKFFRTYLSRKHRDNPERGCVLAALSTELAREGEGVRKYFAAELEGLVKRRREFFSDSGYQMTEKETLQVLATAVGALILSRATRGSIISDQILDAAFDLVEEEIT